MCSWKLCFYYLLYFFYLHNTVKAYFDFELYHNLTEDKYAASKKAQINKLAAHGFGRILTWNVKKLGACLRQDNVDQLKEVVCVILQSANLVVLQEAENLDLSCLPCSTALKDEYEWPGDSANDEFRVFVKTRHSRSFSIKKYGVCDIGSSDLGKKSHFDDQENIYQAVMRDYQIKAEKKQHTGEEHSNTLLESIPSEDSGRFKKPLSNHHSVENNKDSYRNNDSKMEHKLNTDGGTFLGHEALKPEQPLNEIKHPSESKAGIYDFKTKERAKINKFSSKHKERDEETQRINDIKQTSNDFMLKVKQENNRFSKNNHQRKETFNKNSRLSHNENDENEMSNRQIERFHNNNDKDKDNKKTRQKAKLSKEEKDNQRLALESKKNSLKAKLNNSLKNLNKSKDKIDNEDRYRVISKQLQAIESEINELSNDAQEIKSDTNQRFLKANNETSVPTHQKSSASNQRFKQYKTSTKNINDSSKVNKDNKLNRFNFDENDKSVPQQKQGLMDEKTSKQKSADVSNTDHNVYTKIEATDKLLSGIDIDSDRMHNLVNKVLKTAHFVQADENTISEDFLEKLVSHHKTETGIGRSEKRSIKSKKKHKRKQSKRIVRNKFNQNKQRNLKETKGVKRQMFSPNRDATLDRPKNLNYIILTVQSDLNSGEPFIIANLKFPKELQYQRSCMEKVISDISKVNAEFERRAGVLIMGDFHYDRLSGADSKGELYKVNTNLQVDGENFHSPISYLERDPITTVYGRRFDNILSNINVKGNMKTIGPDFPLEPESVILPITLQRLYNNYITALYTTDNDESDKIYECIKAFQMAGKKELDNPVCKQSWVPSSYISDHLPLQFVVKMNLPGKSSPVEIKMASWNIQGDTFKERLLDPAVRRGFLTALKKYHVAVFHEFPPHDRIIDDQELGSSDIVRLRQGDVTTEFGIYVSEYAKEGETDMYVLRKKFKGEKTSEEEILKEPTMEETRNLITTVGLFSPKLLIDTMKIRPCLYTVKTSKAQTSGVDFSRIINAIDKDVQDRKCDFKVMLASLNLEENFDLDKEIYKSFKYINLKCLMNDGDNKFKYNIPRSRDLADYVIVLGHEIDFEFGECTIGLPGDEIKRGIDKLSDFEELTTHYPLSMVLKQSYMTKK